MISYVPGDATDPQGIGPKIIPHIVNDRGGWGRGFVLALSKKWKDPEKIYRDTFRSGSLTLGSCSKPIPVAKDLYVVNMVAQEGYSSPGKPAVDYEALVKCLDVVCLEALKLGASVHAPRFGAGLGGGAWSSIEPLILQSLAQKGIPVTIYDFNGKS